jgi:hypothetical protein
VLLFLAGCMLGFSGCSENDNLLGDDDSGDQQTVGPVLSIFEDAFDFGQVPQQAKVSHIFWLHSTGDDTLRIESVSPG